MNINENILINDKKQQLKINIMNMILKLKVDGAQD